MHFPDTGTGARCQDSKQGQDGLLSAGARGGGEDLARGDPVNQQRTAGALGREVRASHLHRLPFSPCFPFPKKQPKPRHLPAKTQRLPVRRRGRPSFSSRFMAASQHDEPPRWSSPASPPPSLSCSFPKEAAGGPASLSLPLHPLYSFFFFIFAQPQPHFSPPWGAYKRQGHPHPGNGGARREPRGVKTDLSH